MRLALGSESIDVTTRALVLGVVGTVAGGDLIARVEQSCDQGADIVELTGDTFSAHLSEVLARRDVAACVTISTPAGLSAASTAGAVMARPDPGHPAAEFLAVAARAGTTVIVSDGTGTGNVNGSLAPYAGLVAIARRCEEAGLTRSQIVLDGGTSAGGRDRIHRIVSLGYPVMTRGGSGADAEAVVVAQAALAVIGGCRLIRAENVRLARRVVDTLAAVIEAP